MHLPDGPQLDLSTQVARVRAKTRPWKSIIALVLAIAAGVTSAWAHSAFREFFDLDDVPKQIIAAATAVAFCVFASAATIGLSGKARQVFEPVIGASHAAVVRYAIVLVGAVTTLLVTLALFRFPVNQLLLGGALGSVFVGIAAQQSLSNLFAGMVLLFARPFHVGDGVRLQAGALGGQISGTIAEIGITYVRLATSTGVISIPNSLVLDAVVGPLPDPSTYAAAGQPPSMAQPASLPTPQPTAQPAAPPASQPAAPQPTVQHDVQSAPQPAGEPAAPGTPGPRPPGTSA